MPPTISDPVWLLWFSKFVSISCGTHSATDPDSVRCCLSKGSSLTLCSRSRFCLADCRGSVRFWEAVKGCWTGSSELDWTVAVLSERPTCTCVILMEDREFLLRDGKSAACAGSSDSGGKSGLRILLDACRMFPIRLSAWTAIKRKVRRDRAEYVLQVSAWSQVLPGGRIKGESTEDCLKNSWTAYSAYQRIHSIVRTKKGVFILHMVSAARTAALRVTLWNPRSP